MAVADSAAEAARRGLWCRLALAFSLQITKERTLEGKRKYGGRGAGGLSSRTNSNKAMIGRDLTFLQDFLTRTFNALSH